MSKIILSSTRLLILAIYLFGIPALAVAADVDEKYEYWNETLKNAIPNGTSKSDVEEFLKNTNLEYSYSKSTNKYYAIDKDIKNWRIFYEAAILIRIQLDSEEKVSIIEIEKEFTGL